MLRMWKHRENILVTIVSILFLSIVCMHTNGQAKILVDYQKGGVLLSWAEPSRRITGERLLSSEISGYNVYRSLEAQGDYRRINHQLVQDTQYMDRTSEWGNCYYYSLTTIDNRGLEGPQSSVVPAISPLLPPRNVKAFGKKQSVVLKWDKSNNPEIRGYTIYRSEGSEQGYGSIASVLDTDNEFLDQEVIVGKNYYYRVTTVDISWQESERSSEVAATPVFISQKELSYLENIGGFRAAVEKGVVALEWEPVLVEGLAGYNVYRRPAEIKDLNAYKKVNTDLLLETFFYDKDVEPQKKYYYCIAAVDEDNNEAQFPNEIYVTVAGLYINSVAEDSGGCPLKGGRLLAITLTGTPGQKAFALLSGMEVTILLAETDLEGVYYGEYTIPYDINRSNISLIGKLQNEGGDEIEYASKDIIAIDNFPPQGISSLSAEVNSDMVCLQWEILESVDDIGYIAIYRSLEKCPDGVKDDALISEKISPGEFSFCDRSIGPKQEYFYSAVVYDQAGNGAFPDDCFFALTPADTVPPKIHSVKEVSAPGTKGLGDEIVIQVIGEAEAHGSLYLGDKIQQVFQEVNTGRYLAEYVVQAGDDLESEPLLIELIDASGNRSTWQQDLKISINTRDHFIEPPHISLVEHNAFQLGGFAPLVAEDTLRFLVHGDSGCTAYVDLGAMAARSGAQTALELQWDRNLVMSKFGHDIDSYHIYCQDTAYTNVRDLSPIYDLSSAVTHFSMEDYQRGYVAVTAKRRTDEEHLILTPRLQIPLTEVEPGIYEGTYRVRPGDYLWDESVVAYLVNSKGDISSPVRADNPITIDTGLTIMVTPKIKCVKADSKSENEVLFEVKDARDVGVANRELILELFTTFDEYSGIVGVGHFDEDKFGYLDNFTRLITDFGGTISVAYTPGFAAKTIIIRARDEITDCVGLGYITSYVEGEYSFELQPISRARSNGFTLELKADREWLTADNISSMNILATVKDANGRSVPGHIITFVKKSGSGTIRTIRPETNAKGEALALYTAGKSISPPVVIQAIDKTSGNVAEIYVRLKSDAPAKIYIDEKDNDDSLFPLYVNDSRPLYLIIHVEDINKNPNRHIPLEVDIIEGSGRLEFDFGKKTEFNGECGLMYMAGPTSGRVTIRARTTSRIPGPEILDKIRVTDENWY